jgi:hypothetical protein
LLSGIVASMQPRSPLTRPAAVLAIVAAVLIAAVTALASSSITKQRFGQVSIAAGQTRSLTVPFPDALKYGNASYSGRARLLAPAPGRKGGRPTLAKARIISSGAALGGSEYRARAYNGNRAGTAAVTLSVTTATVERLPHS